MSPASRSRAFFGSGVFATFDQNRALVHGLVTAPSLREEFEQSRRVNLLALRALVDRAFPDAPEPERAAAAASLRALVSGSGWVYLRVSCGLSNENVVAAGQWAVRTALARLDAASASTGG